eukprot:11274356-Heterocapsa_arctica.AAC.1
MGGWFKVADLYKTKAKWTTQELFTIAMLNDKQRFQIAVHTVDGDGLNARRLVTKVYAIRCTSGHSITVMPELLSTPLSVNKTKFISAIAHTTRSTNLASIFRYGLAPGG